MTPVSLLHFTEALLWCALLFVSIAGYGTVLLHLFGIRRPSVALAATSGVGVVIFLGGCLNLAQVVTASVLLALIFLGLLAAIILRITLTEPEVQIDSGNPRSPSSRALTLLLVLVAIIFIVRLGASVTQASIRRAMTTTTISPLPPKCFNFTTTLRTRSASAASRPASVATTSSRPWSSSYFHSKTSRWPIVLWALSF